MGEKQTGRTQRQRPGATTDPRTSRRETAFAEVDNDLDRRILHTLSRDGRATLAHLSEATGLSSSAVQARVQRLEQSGAINGYKARLDSRAIGLPLKAFVEITETVHPGSSDITGQLAEWDGIESCYAVSGTASYLLAVRVASPEALDDLLGRLRGTFQVSTSTTLALRTVFEDRPPHLDPLS